MSQIHEKYLDGFLKGSFLGKDGSIERNEISKKGGKEGKIRRERVSLAEKLVKSDDFVAVRTEVVVKHFLCVIWYLRSGCNEV